MELPRKIHIVGGPGSGKTFLAEHLSAQLTYPCVALDEIYWNSDFSKRTTEKERRKQLECVLSKDRWIVEGAYVADWLQPSFDASDVIIGLHTPAMIQQVRLARRLCRRAAMRKTNVAQAINLMRWVKGFEEKASGLHETYPEKYLRMSGNMAVSRCIETIAAHHNRSTEVPI